MFRYEVMKCGDVEKLIRREAVPTSDHVYFVHIDETYDILKRTHIATGHGGRDKMIKALSIKYANITTEVIELFKSLCVECLKKRKRSAVKGVVVRPILSADYGSRAQVDLIDMQSMPNGQYKWIMVYQDHLTKFCVLRPLNTKRAAEVAYQLMDIFLLLGAPQILQSDNGSEFTASVIVELKLLWPDLLIVYGKPRHPQSQGSVERLNCDVKDMLIAWLGDNKTSDWPVGLKFVQFSKNTSHHSGIKQTPYNAIFGVNPRIGLRSAALPDEVLQRMVSEDDLLAAFNHHTEDSVDVIPSTSSTSVDIIPSTTSASLDVIPSMDTSAPTETPGIDNNQNQIKTQRKRAREAMLIQAERMVKRSRIDYVAGNPGDNVTIPIPLVDRGRGDPRNLMGIIVDRDNNDQYRIAVRAGILKGKYSRNQFDLCVQKLLTDTDVSQDEEVALRTAVQKESKCGGQGFVKCNCSGLNKCQTNRCKCFKSKVKCNSRCHSSLTCENKL